MSAGTSGTGLGIRDILKVLPHRYPFLLVDRILEIEPGKKVVGLKNVTFNEEFFQGHFPGNPVMPGVLLIEAMAQVGGFMMLTAVDDPARRQVRLTGLDAVRFRRPVVPGDQVLFSVEFVAMRRSIVKVRGEARVDGQLCAEAEIMSVIQDCGPEELG